MWPITGSGGWETLGSAPDEAPVVKALPVQARAFYNDPHSLGGVGKEIDAVTLEKGRSKCLVRVRSAAVEADFTQRDVYGVVLLDSFEALFGAPCTLLLTVYADDGVTELWSVGTDTAHPRPYLVEPDSYGKQELDVAQGGASLTAVIVTVIDPAQLPGDQDSGWLTGKLANNGLPDIAGHRCRLVRFIDDAQGNVIIVDGPAGFVGLDSSYSGYSWEIRDTRETERAIRCFDKVVLSLLPDELPDGYGDTGGGGFAVVDPARPLRGRFTAAGGVFAGYVGSIAIGLSGFPLNGRRIVITREAYDAILDNSPRSLGVPGFGGESGDQPISNNTVAQVLFKWRALGSGDPWNEIPGQAFQVTLNTEPSTVVRDAYVVGTVTFQDRRLNPLDPIYDPDASALPDDGQDVEFFLYGPIAPDKRHFAIIETPPPIDPDVGVFNPGNAPILGRFELSAVIGGIASGTIDLTATPGNPESFRRLPSSIFDRLENLSTVGDIFTPTGGVFAWRAAGSSDAWTEIELEPENGPSVSIFLQTPVGYLSKVFISVVLTLPAALAPGDGDDIEFTLTVDPPENQALTAGQFAINVYSGLYSERDPDTGALVPTGIRYDKAALLKMTDVVRIRLEDPIEDARDWLESHIFAPTGWVPALDDQARISPISQVAPTETDDLEVVKNAITEPSSAWDSGQRIVNILRFKYVRDFDAGAPDAPIIGGEDRQNDIGVRDVLVEFRDEVSIARHGEQVLELDGSAFREIGATEFYGEAVGTQLQKWNGPTAGTALGPLFQEGETAFKLALLRQLHVQNRYSLGAQTMEVNVMRSAFENLRAGSWVLVDLSWFPDYVTARRGLVALAQVIALGDLDCAWRHLVLEQVTPMAAS